MPLPAILWPLAILSFGAVGLYFLARVLHVPNHALAAVSALILSGALFQAAGLNPEQDTVGGLLFNSGAQLVAMAALLLAMLVSIYCGEYLNLDRRFHVFYPLLLMMMAGLTGMVFASDLFSMYLFCELMSICAYALVAFRKDSDTAIEAGYKYLIMGSAATILILLGIALIFMESGSVQITSMPPLGGAWSEVGILCLFVGLGLKCAMVPMHTWLPDAHGRAPSSISAVLSGILVQSVLFTLVRVCLGLGVNARLLGGALTVIAMANIALGNIMALVQKHTKRLLGYSTIAQMGYLMICLGVGLRSGSALALRAFWFLMAIHMFSKALAFLSKGVLHYYFGATRTADLKGRLAQSPLTGWAFSLGLASLSGLPPLAGFTAKWFLLTSLMEQLDRLGIAAMIMFLAGSVVALGYYLPLIVTLFQSRDDENHPPPASKPLSAWMGVPLVCLGAAILWMTFAPQVYLQHAEGAVNFLLGMIVE